MSGATWTGWQDWEVWTEAGIFGERLDFTDDDIITQQAIHRTGEKIGRCRAMDAAIAFELASAGQEGRVSVKELINDRTREAYLIEQRIVGYGVHRDFDIPTCGHDEVNTTLHKIHIYHHEYQISHEGKLVLFSKEPTQWNHNKYFTIIPDGMDEKYHSLTETFRHEKIDDMYLLYVEYLKEIFDLPTGYEILFNGHCIIQTDTTTGDCAWEDVLVNSGEICGYHDETITKGWVAWENEDGSYKTLYDTEACNRGWNQNQLREHFPLAPNWVEWDTIRRSAIRQVSDKEVRKLIAKSLTRMLKRNKNVVDKEGLRNEAVYSWSDWGWVSEVTRYIVQTRSKNRKAGDVVSGWVYTAINTKRSYGMDMSEFIWMPKTTPVLYTFNISSYSPSEYSWGSGTWKNVFIGNQILFFTTTKEAEEAGQKILTTLCNDYNGIVAKRKYIEGEAGFETEYKIIVDEVSCYFQLKGEIDPEEYKTPHDLMMVAVKASPSVSNEYKDDCVKWKTPLTLKLEQLVIDEGEEE